MTYQDNPHSNDREHDEFTGRRTYHHCIALAAILACDNRLSEKLSPTIEHLHEVIGASHEHASFLIVSALQALEEDGFSETFSGAVILLKLDLLTPETRTAFFRTYFRIASSDGLSEHESALLRVISEAWEVEPPKAKNLGSGARENRVIRPLVALPESTGGPSPISPLLLRLAILAAVLLVLRTLALALA
jgi:hypothetical protein